MRQIKYRQCINGEFHYWGYVDGCFIGPITNQQPNPINDQFTGLLDSEGNEIYEGDIVKGEYFMPSQVIFKGGCFFFDDYPVIESISSEWFVIGNIHQNPELLDNV